MNEDPYFKLWTLVKDLSEQLSQNREVTASLQAQIAQVKVRMCPPSGWSCLRS